VLSQGNPDVILCERGITAFDRQYTRNVLDLGIIPALKEYSHLPVIADPSHGTGVARYVRPMAKAAMVSGADGVMIEMHPNPKEALSDGSQALTPETFISVIEDLKKLAPYVGRTM
jgi:3-deoxy-7-phosphoheptulonate synthase